jgi:hypothetical protein
MWPPKRLQSSWRRIALLLSDRIRNAVERQCGLCLIFRKCSAYCLFGFRIRLVRVRLDQRAVNDSIKIFPCNNENTQPFGSLDFRLDLGCGLGCYNDREDMLIRVIRRGKVLTYRCGARMQQR